MAKVIAKGTAAEMTLVDNALAQSNVPLEPLLAHDFVIEFHTVDEFRQKGFTLPNGDTALGHVAGANVLWINSAYAKRRPGKTKHVVRHEVFHAIQAGKLTATKKTAILPGLRQRDGDVPPKWGGTYQDRPTEILADGLAAYVAGIESPFDGYYGEIVSPAATLALLVAPDPEPPDPQEPPDPTPPDCGGFKVEIDRLLLVVKGLTDANEELRGRIAAKDAKSTESLAL